MSISLIKTITLRNYYYYSTALIVLAITDTADTSSITSSTNLITTSIRRTLNMSSITSLSSCKNSNISSNFNE